MMSSTHLKPNNISSSSSTVQVSQITSFFSSLYLSNNFSDVTFLICDEKLPAHKLIMGSQQYFYTLFNVENQTNMIRLEFDVKPFKAVLKYVYCGHCELSELDVTEILDILILADKFDMLDFSTSIISHLKSVISLSNASAILNLSLRLGFVPLAETCLSLLDRRASEFLLHDDFTTLSQVFFRYSLFTIK